MAVEGPLDVLIPTYNRPSALAATLATLAAQRGVRPGRLIVSDQSAPTSSLDDPAVRACLRLMEVHGWEVERHAHRPRRGMAEQRAFLLERAHAACALFLDDDLLLEPWVLEELLSVIREEACGFVGSAVIGLSYLEDLRPHEQAIEFWDGPVRPERVRPESAAWERHRLHNAANLWHLQRGLPFTPHHPGRYRVAWVGGCVLYDVSKLRATGGFDFWRALPPEHCGEDVLAQLRVMERFGGCGVIPSGVYHQEHPTTVVDRRVDAPRVLLGAEGASGVPGHQV